MHGLFPVVAEFGGRKAGLLSGGQQQQLAIARALIARPDVLLLDEPSLGLAPSVVDTLFETLAEVSPESGVTILLVEQRGMLTVAIRRPHARPRECRTAAHPRRVRRDGCGGASTAKLTAAYLS